MNYNKVCSSVITIVKILCIKCFVMNDNNLTSLTLSYAGETIVQGKIKSHCDFKDKA